MNGMTSSVSFESPPKQLNAIYVTVFGTVSEVIASDLSADVPIEPTFSSVSEVMVLIAPSAPYARLPPRTVSALSKEGR